MKLYYHPLSGHSHRAHLFLSLLGVEHELVFVDLAKGAHKTSEFMAINAFAELPVLDDGGLIIQDSLAIMVYIAKKFGRTDWLPEEPAKAAAVQRWLSVAAGKVAYGPCAARLVTVFGYAFDTREVIARAHDLLKIVDAQLAEGKFIVGDAPTAADVALYSYIERAPEGNVDLSIYTNIRPWLNRIERLPGFTPFQKTNAGLETAA